jgi:hypothetical protein
MRSREIGITASAREERGGESISVFFFLPSYHRKSKSLLQRLCWSFLSLEFLTFVFFLNDFSLSWSEISR